MPLVKSAHTLLIVEDDLDVADMLNTYFRSQGYDVLTVNWGKDGVRACKTTRPDLIILDIRLPDIDGFEVAKRLRASRNTKHIPIIFLTEKNERQDRLLGLEIGGDDYVPKPFDIQELGLRVRNAIQRASQDPLLNPVTHLPEPPLVDERLNELLPSNGWAAILVSIENLNAFSQSYGFIASDDVLRATSLLIHNTVREFGDPDDFLGHLTPTVFILVTAPEKIIEIHKLISTRLEQSLEYFYPLNERGMNEPQGEELLAIQTAVLPSEEGPFGTVDNFKSLLFSKAPSLTL